MSENDIKPEEKPKATPKEASPGQKKAETAGWTTEDKRKGDTADWVDFTQFNLKGELMSRITEQSSIINHLQNKVTDRDKGLKDMADLQDKISKREYDRALKDLLDKKVVALEDNDHSGVVNLDEQISDLKDHKPEPQEVSGDEETNDPNAVPPEILAWMARPENKWYSTDQTLKDMTDGIANGIQSANPSITATDLITQVEIKLKEVMPGRFNRSSNGEDVDSGGDFNNSVNRTNSKLPTFKDLNEDQQSVCRRFERLGTLTREDYIQSLVDIGEL